MIRKVNLIHLFIYLMIIIILSNWYINYTIIPILVIVVFIFFIISTEIIIENWKSKRKLKKLKKRENNENK